MKLLATTDGSERSLQVFPHAASFARALSADLTLLRVLNPAADCASEPDLSLTNAAARVATRWQAELEEHASLLSAPSTVNIAVKARHEDTAEAIVRYAREIDARLIALATRGTGFMRRALIGSIATQVLQRSPVPVMLTGPHIGPAASKYPFRLLVTTDGSDAAMAILPHLQRVTSEARADALRATVLRVFEGTSRDAPDISAASAQLSEFAAQLPAHLSPQTELLVDDAHEGAAGVILKHARDSEADVLWMATHGYSWRRQVLLGSVALEALERAPIPVVLVQAAH